MSARPLSLISLTKLTDDTCRAMTEQKIQTPLKLTGCVNCAGSNKDGKKEIQNISV